jgi:hypothetical protein
VRRDTVIEPMAGHALALIDGFPLCADYVEYGRHMPGATTIA